MEHIVIILAVYHPNAVFLRGQLKSLAQQTHKNFNLIIVEADGQSGTETTSIANVFGLPAVLVSRSTPLNAPKAFEFGLSEALQRFPETKYFAFCDQDDLWAPNRLSAGLAGLQRSRKDLFHSDASLIDENDQMIGPSLFKAERRPKFVTAADLLVKNTVTGMTAIFTRNTAESALPFPPQDGVHYHHDLWIALVATQLRGIEFCNQPLVQYRQHDANAVGLEKPARHPGLYAQLRAGLGAFGLLRYLSTHLARRFSSRKMQRFGRAAIGLVHFQQAARALIRGRLDRAHFSLLFGLLSLGRPIWAMGQVITRGLRPDLNRFDERSFGLSPGVLPPAPKQTRPMKPKPISWWSVFDARQSFRWTPEFTAQVPTINIVVPSLNPSEIFAGIATALDIGIQLAQRGMAVRFIATDLPVASPSATRSFIQSRMDDPNAINNLEFTCGVQNTVIPCHRDDHFIATAWWTAHAIHDAITNKGFNIRRFTYLIQDFEPGFYPWGTEYAGALASYGLPFLPIFNTSLLQRYFEEQKLIPAGIGHAFHPSINTFTYERVERAHNLKPKIAIYGRPEVPRNTFPICIEALGRFLENERLTATDVELVSIGMEHADVELPGGLVLRSAGKIPWADYPAFLGQIDLGLSLMCSPHPSHPPLEMAAAGARVVTNRYGPKDLSALNSSIYSADLSVPAVAKELSRAWADRDKPVSRAINLKLLGQPLDDICEILAAEIEMHRRANAA